MLYDNQSVLETVCCHLGKNEIRILRGNETPASSIAIYFYIRLRIINVVLYKIPEHNCLSDARMLLIVSVNVTQKRLCDKNFTFSIERVLEVLHHKINNLEDFLELLRLFMTCLNDFHNFFDYLTFSFAARYLKKKQSIYH